MPDSESEEYCSAESEVGEDFEHLSFDNKLSIDSTSEMSSQISTETSSGNIKVCGASDDSEDDNEGSSRASGETASDDYCETSAASEEDENVRPPHASDNVGVASKDEKPQRVAADSSEATADKNEKPPHASENAGESSEDKKPKRVASDDSCESSAASEDENERPQRVASDDDFETSEDEKPQHVATDSSEASEDVKSPHASDDNCETSAASEHENEIPPQPVKKEMKTTPLQIVENSDSVHVSPQNQDPGVPSTSSAIIKKPVKQESNDADAKVEFGFCENPIELYESDKTLYYDYFAKDSESPIPVFDSQLLDNLSDLQIETMRPVQVAAFQALFFPSPNASKPDKQPDFLGISRTGSGKTLAFLVPIIQKCMDRLQSLREKRTRNPLVLIFAHSTTLVKNIYERAMELVKDTEVDVQLISGQTSFIRDAHFDIGVCTIGRFLNHFGSDKRSGRDVILNINDVKFLVIDEADKMAAEDQFVDLYEKMKQKSDFTTLAFSATNSYEVSKFLDADNYYQFLYGALNTVSTAIKQLMWQVDSRCFSRFIGAAHGTPDIINYKEGQNPHPMDVLIIFLKKQPKKRFMIFAKRNLVAEVIARKLTMHGLDAVAVHGDQSAESKKKFLKFFVDGKVRIIVATNLLTRGTDIPVDYVVNYDLPLSYTEYVHRCGRTGRNKEQGHAITFIDLKNPDDYPLQVLQEIILHLPDDFKMPAFLAESAEMLRNTKKSKEEYAQENFLS